ncbi:DNA polymerase III subunit delta' [Salmonella enterica subsp. enterica]|uniref:DNA polymerase III subunit delta n=3 Tax=Salmonella enterica TaxID=28901 RepID=A0A3S4FME4_SALET|nr:DNA polymerase III subunit delta' [Salmonella enterica subsp. enterica]
MQAGTHPDYYTLMPDKGKSSLGVDAVREVSEKLYEHSRLGGAKVVWIADAALLTDAAANALLKTLEEPPEQTWFFLASPEPARLLATLRSRCRLHHLAPPSESYAMSWLSREVTASQEALLTALRLNAGSPGAALALLQSERWAQREALCQALMDSLHTGDWYALLTALNHEQAPARLHWLATLLVDALKRQHGASYLTNVDADAVVAALAGPLSPARIQAILNDVCHCRDQLLHVTGLNRELVLTDSHSPHRALPATRHLVACSSSLRETLCFLVDSHCHLDGLDYQSLHKDVDDVLAKAAARDVKFCLAVATTLPGYRHMRELVGKRDNVVFSCGVHPLNQDEAYDVEELRLLAAEDDVVAMGETGLDYFYTPETKIRQQASFIHHIQIGRELHKPVIVHTRDARADTLAILREEKVTDCGGVLHCFTEDRETAGKLLDLGFYISFSGIVTFRNAEQFA